MIAYYVSALRVEQANNEKAGSLFPAAVRALGSFFRTEACSLRVLPHPMNAAPSWGTDSAGNQSAAGSLPRPSMKGARGRDRASLKYARAWFHCVVCSRPIGAGDPSQDARGERRRGEERGASADGKVSRARLTRKNRIPARFSLSWATPAMRVSPKGVL